MKKREKNKISSYERQIHLDISYFEHCRRLEQISRALSTEIRMKILSRLHIQAMSPSELASYFKIPLSSVMFNLQLLEEAGLITIQKPIGKQKIRSMVATTIDIITITVRNTASFPKHQTLQIEMPIGDYFECSVFPSCGMADEKGVIEALDDPRVFYSIQRKNAQLIWFQQGTIEYRFPNNFACIQEKTIKKLSFSMEICSEISGFSDTWSSDIGIYINGKKAILYHSPGDFGTRRGKITPEVWGYGSTQYGLLKTFSFTEDGAFIDEYFIENSPRLEEFQLDQGMYISLLIEASYPGGVNLFGNLYGDHPQHLIMSLEY
ncbi:MAG: ArsR/SmtB family transcription factor [Brevinema sp.]